MKACLLAGTLTAGLAATASVAATVSGPEAPGPESAGPEAYAPFTPEWARAMELQDLAAHRARRDAEDRNATRRLNGASPSQAAAPSSYSTPSPYPASVQAAPAYAGPASSAYGPTQDAASPWPSSYAAVGPGSGFGPAVAFRDDARPMERFDPGRTGGVAAIERRDIWREGDGHSDRLRLTTRGALRRADGAPVPPTALNAAGFEADSYDVSYTRGWEAARGYTASGLEVTLTPHAGFGVGDSGGTAEAGATLRIGSGMDSVAPRGSERFGDRARWYVYAAGSGRAVGYNFARTRDGEFTRSGMSHDSGSFLGDASIGVAYRKGDMQGSFGVVYREIEAEGLRGGEGFDRDVSEGLVAFQLSIKPDR